MIELLSPAGSPEAVIAAVQNGADAIYLGFGDYNARRNAKNFSEEEFAKAVRYCHIRGCKVYVTLNTLVNDREMSGVVDVARCASDLGADAILVQDLGLASVLSKAVPDIPLHASTQMSIHNLAGVQAAAEMGMTRAVLARELSLEQIKYICSKSPIEIEVFVHGALCFCHSGQCYMSALIGRRSGNRGMCAQPCRMQYTLGDSLNNYPLSLKDSCLVDRLKELEDAGVVCAKIEGRMKRPEYVAVTTGIYSRAIREGKEPTSEEIEMLKSAFSRQGFTQGYFDGDKQNMFGIREDSGKDAEKMFSQVRKEYADKELRRVNVKFYARARAGYPFQAIAEDEDGHKVIYEGQVPDKAVNQQLTTQNIDTQMNKTGGTPYICLESQSRAEDGLYLSASALNEARRELISKLTEARATPPKRRSLIMPKLPDGKQYVGQPNLIFQVLNAEQLTPELAELGPTHIYVPAKVMLENFGLLEPFTLKGTIPVAVMPRVIPDNEIPEISETLDKLFEMGINEVLCGNLGHIMIARKSKLNVRADFGMNVFNSWTLETLSKTGLLSATASFEMRLSQIKDLSKSIDTEVIAYGRLPLMISEQGLTDINEAGAKQNVVQLADRTGSVFPVVKAENNRSAIYNAHKLYLADKLEDLFSCGLWGVRLMFTTESARECVDVAKSYCGMSDYKPNVLTRGLYYRGVD